MWQSEAAVLDAKIHTKHQVCSPGKGARNAARTQESQTNEL